MLFNLWFPQTFLELKIVRNNNITARLISLLSPWLSPSRSEFRRDRGGRTISASAVQAFLAALRRRLLSSVTETAAANFRPFVKGLISKEWYDFLVRPPSLPDMSKARAAPARFVQHASKVLLLITFGSATT